MTTEPQFDTTTTHYEADPSKQMQKLLPHIPINIEDIKTNPNEELIYIAQMMEAAFKVLLDTSRRDNVQLEEVRIKWMNILDMERNPDSLNGFFRVVGRATKITP